MKNVFPILMMFALFLVPIFWSALVQSPNTISKTNFEIKRISDNSINNDYSNFNNLNDMDLMNPIKEYQFENKNNPLYNKLGYELSRVLDLYIKTNYQDVKNIKIIMMFNKGVNKERMLKTIDDLNWASSIKEIFKYIPAVLIETNSKDLYSRLNLINSNQYIYKLFNDAIINLGEYTSVNLEHYQAFSDLGGASKDPIISEESFKERANTPLASYLNQNNWWLKAIGAENLGVNGSNVKIAILDTGISHKHSDLVNKDPFVYNINFVKDYDNNSVDPSDWFDRNGHGTHVAGIAAGLGLSSDGKYVGVAPGARLYNVKVANVSGSVETSDVINAVQWCIDNNVDIISMSFGSAYPEVYDPESAILNEAVRRGITAVAAAGNSGPAFITAGSPAAIESVISVGATDQYNQVADFSSLGPSYENQVMPDVLAPGVNIISTEAYGSLLSRYVRYTSDQINGKYIYSDYIPLSGTSMATPVVAGAAALIKSAFPNITPEGIRIALYKGAYSINDSKNSDLGISGKFGDNGIGAGIINVSNSIKWLQNQANISELVKVFPNKLPVAPFDLISYPGEEQHTNLSILYSGLNPKTVNITIPSDNSVLITSDKSQINFSNHSIRFMDLGIKVKDNATIGEKSIIVNITDANNGNLLDTINITLDIKYPKGSIYFDSFHGLNDMYPEWITGYMQLDLYQSMKVLHNNGYRLKYQMQNWTFNYNYSSDAQIITPDKLFDNDIVVLQTPIIPYNDYELNALGEFVNAGGSILLLGTRSQWMNVNSINKMLNYLNCGISISDNNIINLTDLGLGFTLQHYKVTNVNDSFPIFKDGKNFAFWYGAKLLINDSSPNTFSIANLNNGNVVATYNGTAQDRGNVVVWSDYHWLRYDIFGTDAQLKLDHKNILLDLMDYLNTRNKFNNSDISIEATFNTTQSQGSDVSFDLSLLNNTNGQPLNSLLVGKDLNATLIYPDNSELNISLINQGNGIYYNGSLTLGASNNSPYSIKISLSLGNGRIIEKTFKLFRISASDMVIINDLGVDKASVDRNNSKNTIHFSSNSVSTNIDTYGTLTTSSIYSNKSAANYNLSLAYNPLHADFEGDFSINDSVPAGYLVYYPLGNKSNFINFKCPRGVFTILNYDPQIDKLHSYFNNILFNDTITEDSYYIQQINTATPASFIIKAKEKVTYEDMSGQLTGSIIYLVAASASGILMPIYPNSIPFTKLSYTMTTDTFNGQIQIPSQLPFESLKSGSINVTQQSPSDLSYFSLLWITIRDSDGGSDDFLVILYVTVSNNIGGGISDYLPIIIILGAILALTIFLILRSRHAPKNDFYDEGLYYTDDGRGYSGDNNYTDYYQEDQNEMATGGWKYCFNCGQKVPQDARFCPNCGQELY
ncbi:MAG: S8 family serine peptidase [Promethearchaeota archaeon]